MTDERLAKELLKLALVVMQITPDTFMAEPYPFPPDKPPTQQPHRFVHYLRRAWKSFGKGYKVHKVSKNSVRGLTGTWIRGYAFMPTETRHAVEDFPVLYLSRNTSPRADVPLPPMRDVVLTRSGAPNVFSVWFYNPHLDEPVPVSQDAALLREVEKYKKEITEWDHT